MESQRQCATPGCDRLAPPGGEGNFNICAKCLGAMAAKGDTKREAPIPMRLICPDCGALHVDVGEFATKVHHTHACQACGAVWRPAVVATVGVRFLPGFKNPEAA